MEYLLVGEVNDKVYRMTLWGFLLCMDGRVHQWNATAIDDCE